MTIGGAVGGVCCLLVCIVGGGRLVVLSLRTRRFPEFALGAGMLLMGGIATPLGPGPLRQLESHVGGQRIAPNAQIHHAIAVPGGRKDRVRDRFRSQRGFRA